MNIEDRKTLCRFAIYLLFWSVVALAAWLFLAPSSGEGGGPGRGRGNGSNMRAPGAGEGRAGEGAGRHAPGRGSGTVQNKAGGGGPLRPAPPAPVTPKKTEVPKPPVQAKGRAPSAAPPKPAPIRIVTGKPSSDTAPSISMAPELAARARSGASSPGPGNDGAQAGEGEGFFGVKVKGHDRIIFLLDISGSMESTTADGRQRRHELMRKEMEKCLKAGFRDAFWEKKDGIFLIVYFNHETRFFPEDGRTCSFSSQDQVNEALHFVKTVPVGGGTSMMLAWNRILPLIARHEIQTVCFLSDGEPTDCGEKDLLDFLKKKAPRLKIHTFSMGGSSSLLEKTAKQHGGTYREIF